MLRLYIIAAMIVAAALVLLTILSVISVQYIGSAITHGDNTIQHEHGIIISKSDEHDTLVFRTDKGEVLSLLCQKRCLSEFGHMQRHIIEHAPTDLYYQDTGSTLIAIDID